MPYDPIIVKVKTDKTTAVVASSGGASFGVVNVTGQNNVVATKTTDILKVRPGTGVSITTDAPNNTLTITATGGSAFDSVARDIANGAFEQANSAALRANTLVTDNVPETTTNLYFTSDRVRGNVSNIFPISYNVTTGEFGVVASNANGSVLISNTISGGYDVSQLTGGLGIIVTTSAGGIKIDAANGGADVFARIQANNAYAHANGAFVKANIAATNADAAFLQANSAALRANTLVTDNVPETTTNLYFTAARVRANVSNTAPINYNPTTGVISHASSGVGATTYGNATFVSQVTIDAFGHVTGASNIAIDQSLAQSARDHANGAFNQANTANLIASSAALRANTLVTDNVPETTTNLYFTAARVRANISNTTPINYNPTTGVISHADSGITAKTYGNNTLIPQLTVDARGHVTAITNVAITGLPASTANGQLLIGNTVSGSFDVNTLTQGTGITITNDKGSITIAATGGSSLDQFARDTANGAYAHANGAFDKANAANVLAQTARDHANGAFTSSNTKVANSGVTVNGSLHIGNTVSGGYDVRTLTAGFGVTVTNGQGTITIDAFDQFARDRANGAYTTSNSAYSHANGAFSTTNAAFTKANAATPNTATSNGQIYAGNTVSGTFDLTTIAQTSPVIVTNGRGTVTLSHASSGVGATTYGNSTFVSRVTVDQFGHITSASNVAIDQSLAQTARDHANGAFTTANSSYAHANGAFTSSNTKVANSGVTVNGSVLIGNTVSGGYDVRGITQTAPIIVTNGQGTITLSHASSGVGATTYGNANHSFQGTVDQFGHLTSVSNTKIAIGASQITSGATVNGQLLIGNTVSGGFDISTLTQGTGILITNDKGSVTIAATGGSSLDQFARDTANGAFATANSAYAHANGAFAAANTKVANSGVTVNGSVLIGNTVSGGYDLRTIAQSAPVIVTNDRGSIVLSHARSGVVATGYGDAASIPVFVVDANGHITSVTNTTVAITTSQVTESAGGPFYHTAARVRGNVSATTPISYDSGTGVFSHSTSGVTATGYGDAASIPVFVVNATGHVTSVTNTSIAIAASQITSGTLSVARGGTGQTSITVNGSVLIGNTVSGGYDLNTLTQGTGIVITNDKGSITIAATGGASTDQFARDTANGAYAHANGAFDKANAAVANSGVTVNGSILIGNTVSGGYDLKTLTQGSGVTITNGQGTITIAATGGGGNSFGVINVASLNQSNVYAGAANDTLILTAGVGMNVTTNVVVEKIVQFHVNPGYLHAISSGHALYAL